MVDKKPINIAVFEYEDNGQLHECTGKSFEDKDDAIHIAIEIFRMQGIESNQIKRIYSEWKPSPKVEKLIRENYPEVALTYSFEEGDEEEFEQTISKLQKKPWWRFW